MGALQYQWDSKNPGADSLRIRFDPCTRSPKELKEELYAAARAITNRAKRAIWICAGGGLYSEVACRAFYDQGIHFSVLTLEHSSAEPVGADRMSRWCRERAIPQKVIRFDTFGFLGSDMETYKRYVTPDPGRYFQIKLMQLVEEMEGYAVLGSGAQVYRVDARKPCITRADLYLEFSTGSVAPLAWCTDNGLSHEPYFHFATPELCLSYERFPLIAQALNEPDPLFRHTANTHLLRRIVYQSLWPDMEVRRQSSYLQEAGAAYGSASERLRDRFAGRFGKVEVPLSVFERQLLGTASALS